MTQVPSHLLYSREHSWVDVIAPNVVRVGVTDFVQDQLGFIVFVELPLLGVSIVADESVGSVESVKTVSDILSPISGEVVQINQLLEKSPEKVNDQPYGEGWLFEVKISGMDELRSLLTAEQYSALTEG
jgi:glycine cleavage system H protein